MFKEMGQLMGLMKNVGKIKEEMANLQGRLGRIEADGEAGAGMVKVRVNGQLELLKVSLTDESLKDREMLEDLVVAACNQALKKVRELVAEETQKMATGLGLPPGMGLPGLGG
jgi:DNA-binding YbaB/EbfC family protein